MTGSPLTPDDAIRAADRQLIGDVWTSDEAWSHCEALVDRFPRRYAGHPDEAGARDYLLAALERYGVAARAEPFPCMHWSAGSAELIIHSPERRAISGVNLPMNVDTEVTAEIGFVEEGTPAQYAAYADRVADRIVLVTSRCPAYSHRPRTCRREKYLRAVEGGARGFLYMRHEGGLLPETYSLSADGPPPIPGLSLTREAGAEILRLLARGPVRATLRTAGQVSPGTSWNIVGDMPGPRRRDRVILVGAHYDTLIGCPGAVDDASGAAVLLEVARALSKHAPLLGTTVRFAFFGLEEGGLQGAYAYTEAHAGGLGAVDFMLNVDGAGFGDPHKGVGLQGWPELIPFFRRLGREMREDFPVDVWITPNSDMHPFLLRGVPCAWLFDLGMSLANLGWPHTAADSLDKISRRSLRTVALLVARLLLYMTNRDWPGRHARPEEVAAWLSEWNLEPRTKWRMDI